MNSQTIRVADRGSQTPHEECVDRYQNHQKKLNESNRRLDSVTNSSNEIRKKLRDAKNETYAMNKLLKKEQAFLKIFDDCITNSSRPQSSYSSVVHRPFQSHDGASSSNNFKIYENRKHVPQHDKSHFKHHNENHGFIQGEKRFHNQGNFQRNDNPGNYYRNREQRHYNEGHFKRDDNSHGQNNYRRFNSDKKNCCCEGCRR